MAPAIVHGITSSVHLSKIASAASSTFTSLSHRAVDASRPPLASLFTLAINHAGILPKRAISLQGTGSASIAGIAVAPLPIVKRQNAILAIPATYAGLNSGPPPGTVVGIMLGSIAGFILCLYLLLFSFQFVGNRTTTVIKEEVITTRHQSRSRSRSKHTVERSPPRQQGRRETIIIEERVRVPPPPRERSRSYSPDEVVVEEEQSVSEDIVEVIEEQSTVLSPSPPPEPQRRESRRSGFRTVNPAEPGGGDAPLRRIKKR